MLLQMREKQDELTGGARSSEIVTSVAVTASPWDREASGRRWVRLIVEVEVVLDRSTLTAYRHRLVVEGGPPKVEDFGEPSRTARRKDGKKAMIVEAVGILGEVGISSYLYVNLKLAPGEYQVGEPGRPGCHVRFRLPLAPGGPVMLCRHSTIQPSTFETRSLFNEGHQYAWGDQRITLQRCCREKLASWRAAQQYALVVYRPLRGVLCLTVNGREYHVAPGEYMVFNPSDLGGLEDHQRWPVKFLTMVAGQSAIRQVREAAGWPKSLGSFGFEPGPRRPGGDLKRAWGLWESAQETRGVVGGEALLRSAGHAMVVCLVREHPNALRARVDVSLGVEGRDPRFQRILAHMRKHFHRPLDIRAMAREHGVSARWLRAQCQASVGQSPLQVIQDLRVQRAVELLKNPAYSIDEVARLVGYKEERAFYRVFKARMQRTPRMLRP